MCPDQNVSLDTYHVSLDTFLKNVPKFTNDVRKRLETLNNNVECYEQCLVEGGNSSNSRYFTCGTLDRSLKFAKSRFTHKIIIIILNRFFSWKTQGKHENQGPSVRNKPRLWVKMSFGHPRYKCTARCGTLGLTRGSNVPKSRNNVI